MRERFATITAPWRCSCSPTLKPAPCVGGDFLPSSDIVAWRAIFLYVDGCSVASIGLMNNRSMKTSPSAHESEIEPLNA
jgi:hypothetical protein